VKGDITKTNEAAENEILKREREREMVGRVRETVARFVYDCR